MWINRAKYEVEKSQAKQRFYESEEGQKIIVERLGGR